MFLPKAITGYNGKHEKLSTSMFDHLLVENGITAQLNNEDREFIKRLILACTLYHLRADNGDDNGPDDRTFLYEIVANKKNGVDVDKWDYFARDCHQLGITNNFDHMRFLKFTRVICDEGDGKKHICFRDKEEQNIYNMFYTRTLLHRCAYKHGVTQAIEIMLTDALLKANDHLMIYGKDNQPLKMSECVDDMVAFSKLTDNVYYDILHGEPRIKELGKAADILRRLERRDLYRCISQTKPRNCSEIVEVAIEEISKRVVELSGGSVEAVDFKILVVKFDYGMGEKNPVESVLFYQKNDPEKAVSRENMEMASLMLPATFCECILRFFWKKSGADPDIGRQAFEAWLEEDEDWQKSGNATVNGKMAVASEGGRRRKLLSLTQRLFAASASRPPTSANPLGE
ncbi:Deoxynucleoside triphosphate triphosphohydrolase SAMHD1 [Lamellibrachia satsuma]|nr:Deoxynucleoside triphosphate triphosphohydrolase SAMHD1 [Lamellibrachia satsuma]